MQLVTRIRSTAASYLSSARFARLLQRIARGKRKLARQAPCVHYFHQVDDPYSHLAVQKLHQLRAQYALPFIVHLVSESADDYKGSADDFAIWAQRDAVAIAAGYATTLSISHNPTPSQVLQANRKLSPHLTSDTFARIAQQVGNDLWTNNLDPEPSNEENTTQTNNALAAGDALR